jgi:TolB protein
MAGMIRLILASIFICLGAHAQVGIFEAQSDVGAVMHPGSADFDSSTKRYTVTGSGDNMWAAQDQFHYVWKKVTASDLTLSATIEMAAGDGDGHRKGVLMIRQTLDDDSAYVDAARHGDGLTSLQYRVRRGEVTHEVESNTSGPVKLRIEKQGDVFYLWIGGMEGDWQFSGAAAKVALQAPFYVGIGVCAHKKDALEKTVFSNVELSTRVDHPHTLYSTVETVMLSGDARSGYVAPKRIVKPGWSADGHSLTFESEGKQEETIFTPLRTAAPVGPPVEVVKSEAKPLPSDGFNNVSPFPSPDGKYLLFLSYAKDLKQLPEDGELTLRVMTLATGAIRSLATFTGGPGSLGPSPWSPDGRRIVFVSYQAMD